MAASMNDIKARMKSVKSTMQITKAMELVATSKLRRAKEKAESSRPYHEILTKVIRSLESSSDVSASVWSEMREVKKTLFVVIAGDRGLAGGYNSNIFRLTEELARGSESAVLPIGKKALEYFKHKGREIFSDALALTASVGVGDTLSMGAEIAEAYKSGAFDKVTLVYTRFVSMLSQLPVHYDVLPFESGEGCDDMKDALIECDVDEMLDKIVPEYVGGVIWSAVCESTASEHGARRTSMNAANKNAEEMIGDLMLKYNRARQAVITQEITEIVSSAEAL